MATYLLGVGDECHAAGGIGADCIHDADAEAHTQHCSYKDSDIRSNIRSGL